MGARSTLIQAEVAVVGNDNGEGFAKSDSDGNGGGDDGDGDGEDDGEDGDRAGMARVGGTIEEEMMIVMVMTIMVTVIAMGKEMAR